MPLGLLGIMAVVAVFLEQRLDVLTEVLGRQGRAQGDQDREAEAPEIEAPIEATAEASPAATADASPSSTSDLRSSRSPSPAPFGRSRNASAAESTVAQPAADPLDGVEGEMGEIAEVVVGGPGERDQRIHATSAQTAPGASEPNQPPCLLRIQEIGDVRPLQVRRGLTEEQAKAPGIKVKKGLFPWSASGRAIANGRDEGFTKLLFDDSPEAHGHGRILELVLGSTTEYVLRNTDCPVFLYR